MLTLLIAAIGRQKKDHCQDYVIRIKGPQDNLFIDDKDVLKILKTTLNGDIKGQRRSAFDLQHLEQQLEKSIWIKDAELYFDNHDVLHITVTEREPIARLFTVSGKSSYLDETGKLMPLSDKMSARVPVFTSFPDKIISRRDSTLVNNIRTAATLILHDPFWMAQVSQIDITPERNFEMTPVVGNHVVLLGDGENMDRKFHRLFVFYKNVLNQTGFDKYKTIDVRYAGQVIAAKNRQDARIDTSQLRLNVEKLLREAGEVPNDSLIAVQALKEQKEIKVDPGMSATEKATDPTDITEPNNPNNPVLVTSPVPMKPLSDPKSREKPKQGPKPVNDNRQPKAVMPKRSQ